jgi:hypothetical protein
MKRHRRNSVKAAKAAVKPIHRAQRPGDNGQHGEVRRGRAHGLNIEGISSKGLEGD